MTVEMYEDMRCNINSVYDPCCSWWTICVSSETNGDKWQLPVDFCRLDCRGESAWALLILSSLAMRMNVRHYAWSAMTTIFAFRKCWRILKSHALTESAALRFGSPKSLFSLHPCRSRFSFLPFPSFLCAFCLFIWEYDLSWWLREEIEKKCLLQEKKKCL